MLKFGTILLAASAVLASPATAQRPGEEALRAEQRAAMEAFAWTDGVWRGTAWSQTPQGEITLTQTERIGTMSDGTVRIIEGRGYGEDGELLFNAVAMIGFDPVADEYVMTTSAGGRTGRPWFKATETGFEWGFETGPAKIRYVAVHDDGSWSQEGFVTMGDAEPRKFLTMDLKCIGDTDWPGEGSIGPE